MTTIPNYVKEPLWHKIYTNSNDECYKRYAADHNEQMEAEYKQRLYKYMEAERIKNEHKCVRDIFEIDYLSCELDSRESSDKLLKEIFVFMESIKKKYGTAERKIIKEALIKTSWD